jgi:ABC-2 type transport system permease protein
MSAVASSSGPARAGAPQALRAEWVKLRTVRSTAWSLLTLVGVSILFTALACWESETMGGSPGRPGDNDVVLDSLAGIWFGQIGAAVLAVLVITSEYSTGMIRTTFAASPRRRAVLVAKATLVGALVLVVGLATCATCFLFGQEILQGNGFTYENGYPGKSLADGTVFRAVVGSAVYLAMLAVFSLGVGTILRHTAGAITIVLAVVLTPVIAIGFLPEHVAEWFEKYSHGSRSFDPADRRAAREHPARPWGGLAVVTAYAATAFLVALVSIARRDA